MNRFTFGRARRFVERARRTITSFLVGALAATGVLVFAPQLANASASATVSFSTDKPNYTVGDSLRLTVNTNVTEFTAGEMEVRVNYDNSQLEAPTVDATGSVFPNQFQQTSTTSSQFSIRFTNSSGFSGDGTFIVYTFKIKAVGDATFSFSDLKVFELGTGVSEPITGASKTVAIAAVVTAPPPTTPPTTPPPIAPTPQPVTPAPQPTATPSPAPPPTPKSPTTKPKVTARITAKPVPRPSDLPTANPNDVSANQSTVTLSKDSAVADGSDAITVCVVIKHGDGTVATNIEPVLTGLRPNSDTATPFRFNSTDQSWCGDLTSVAAGAITLTVSANTTTLATKDITFTAVTTPLPLEPAPPPKKSFGLTIIAGVIGILLLLLLLWWLYHKLRERRDEDEELENLGDETGPAYPGDEPTAGNRGGEPSAAPPTAESPDETAEFNPTAALERGATDKETSTSPPSSPSTAPPVP